MDFACGRCFRNLNTKVKNWCDLTGCAYKDCGPDNVCNSLVTPNDNISGFEEETDLSKRSRRLKRQRASMLENQDIHIHDRETLLMQRAATVEEINKDSASKLTLVLADEETEQDSFFPKPYPMRRTFPMTHMPRASHGGVVREDPLGLDSDISKDLMAQGYVQERPGVWRMGMQKQLGLPLVDNPQDGDGDPHAYLALVEDEEMDEDLAMMQRKRMEQDLQAAFNRWEGNSEGDPTLDGIDSASNDDLNTSRTLH